MKDKPKDRTPLTFLIAQPRSGSTLMLRLMNIAVSGGHLMYGDRQPEVYKALIDLDQHHIRGGVFGLPNALERHDTFCDHYNGTFEAVEYMHMNDIVKLTLFSQYGNAPMHAKSGILGFGNDYLMPFVEMLHNRFSDVKIVYLTRWHESIVESFMTTDHPVCKGLCEKTLLRLLDEQYEQMVKCFNKFDGVFANYDDVVSDPTRYMNAMRPVGEIDNDLVKQVMAKKLRTPTH